jgi:drug/metabolite transporter (DMT)-like permease
MKTLLSNILLVSVVALISVAISLVASFYSEQWHWFGRSGSIMAICGVILTIRPIIRLGLKKWIEVQNTIDGGSFKPPPEEKEKDRQSDLDHKASQIGSFLAILGTIIWGYGDLVGRLLN